MKSKKSSNKLLLAVLVACISIQGCKKTSMYSYPVASLNVVNALPNSSALILGKGSALSSVGNFSNIAPLFYASNAIFTPIVGLDTFFAIQSNFDTTFVGSKAPVFIFDSVLSFKAGALYSLFITGKDTTSPDYLFVQDLLPVVRDSAMEIRFVNLSASSNPFSVNLEGNGNGTEVASLPYKGITGFKQYSNNSTTLDYLFVVRDAVTGDSLTQFDFLASGSGNNGNGLTDPSNSSNNGTLLTFKCVTIAIYGSENILSNNPLGAMLIDNY